MNEQNNTQNTQAQETTKKVTVKDVLKVGGVFILGGAIGAGAMYLYEKNSDNNTNSNSESAFI